ncbi:AAA domain-containing protein [Streptomyces sp. NBC_01474]|uniref:AAA domain-containing protein n=1 Tax=Streptomyces sp. NBC_01474 TaxID=2903880 RepID=UPI002DDB84A7|nr:AAA domain-containing protein [Streptomyces sp. NBC_01474]WSD92774.1 AAA domain-containing protein [Streptomyces sp. NBC_01474]WSE01281.1 AAA domain-containing protein [Streptomyces sp. NBC_01474]
MADALGAGAPGAGLASAAEVDTARRVDLRRDPQAALGGVGPSCTPAGRWPAEPGHPLALCQQFAVNTMWAQLQRAGGVFAVNGPTDGHWIPEEGRAVRRILEKLRDQGGVDLAGNVYVISPFKAVVHGAQRASRGLLPEKRVGTIHTTQGKEADVVILILGSGPRRPGARAWAASRPNLLNVGVSRAKRRLFVIGNRETWQEQRYFTPLADQLPAHTWKL